MPYLSCIDRRPGNTNQQHILDVPFGSLRDLLGVFPQTLKNNIRRERHDPICYRLAELDVECESSEYLFHSQVSPWRTMKVLV
jgi:hypothetical protein